jgi:hypothetical protein
MPIRIVVRDFSWAVARAVLFFEEESGPGGMGIRGVETMRRPRSDSEPTSARGVAMRRPRSDSDPTSARGVATRRPRSDSVPVMEVLDAVFAGGLAADLEGFALFELRPHEAGLAFIAVEDFLAHGRRLVPVEGKRFLFLCPAKCSTPGRGSPGNIHN